MSIEALCQGDQVIVQVPTTARGASGGQSTTYAAGNTLDCLIQTDGSPSTAFQARGSRYSHTAFFSADPSLSANRVLKWTVKGGATLAVPIYLRVLACYSEGRPGEDLLWIANCEVETNRPET